MCFHRESEMFFHRENEMFFHRQNEITDFLSMESEMGNEVNEVVWCVAPMIINLIKIQR